MKRTSNFQPSRLRVDLGKDRQLLVAIAQEVAIQRGRALAESLFHIAAVRSLQTSPELGARALVRCVAAHVQLTSGQHGQEAAHLLPGQILIAGRPVWFLAATQTAALQPEVKRLSQQLQMCFAWTNVLPDVFNKADSGAEGNGRTLDRLKPLFGDVVGELWRTARVDSRRPFVIDRAAVLRALERWFREVEAIYAAASLRKAKSNFPEEARVLETYAQSFRVANAARFVLAHLPEIHQRYSFLPGE